MSYCTMCVITLLLLFGHGAALAQGLDEQLPKLAGAAGKAYVAPLVTNLSVSMNSGWLNRAPAKTRLGFDLEFGVVGMASSLTSNTAKSFSLTSTFRFSKSQATELISSVTDVDARNDLLQQLTSQDFTVQMFGATIAGDFSNTIKVFFPQKDFTVNGPFPVTVTLPSKSIDLGVGGLLGELKYLPAAAPQLKLGTLFGTRAVLRLLPEVSLQDSLGKFSYLGFGLEHNIAYWLGPLVPVDITAGFLTQTSKLGNTMEFTSTTYGISASKYFGGFGVGITTYAGFSLETGSLSVNLVQKIQTYSGLQETKIAFDVESEGKSRVTVGAYIKIFLLGINLEYAAAKVGTFSGSLLFNF